MAGFHGPPIAGTAAHDTLWAAADIYPGLAEHHAVVTVFLSQKGRDGKRNFTLIVKSDRGGRASPSRNALGLPRHNRNSPLGRPPGHGVFPTVGTNDLLPVAPEA